MLKKTTNFRKILVLLIAIFSTGSTYAQNNELYYNYGKEKIHLKPRLDKLVIKFIPELTFESQKQLLKNPILKPFIHPASVELPNIIILETIEGTTFEQIQNYLIQLRKKKEILSASNFYSTNINGQVAMMDEILVKLKFLDDAYILENNLREFGLEIVGPNRFDPLSYKVRLTKAASGNAVSIANQLHESAKFAYASPNFLMVAEPTSVDPLYNEQWYLENNGQALPNGVTGIPGADMDVDLAWNNATGSGVTIAILDYGVERTHPDLGGYRIPGARVLDGYNVFTHTYNGSNTGTFPTDAHGTVCAGIAAATKDNNLGIAGVAPNASIMPIKLLGPPPFYQTTPEVIADAFRFATCNMADVISNSYKVIQHDVIEDAVDNAVKYGRAGKGAVVLFAAGNDNSYSHNYTWPPESAILVGAASMCNERKSYVMHSSIASCDGEQWGSNYGPELDIVAPGVLMWTTDLTGTAGENTASGIAGDYSLFGGTSAATPAAAGVAALIISTDNCITGSEVREILEGTAQQVGNYIYDPSNKYPNFPNLAWNEEMGFGLVNADLAVSEAISRGSRTCGIGIQWYACIPIDSRISQLQSTNFGLNSNKILINSYPNPFNYSLTFKYELPSEENVSLKIYDLLGNCVATLIENEVQKEGIHEISFNGGRLPIGIYQFTIVTGNKNFTQKVVKSY